VVHAGPSHQLQQLSHTLPFQLDFFSTCLLNKLLHAQPILTNVEVKVTATGLLPKSPLIMLLIAKEFWKSSNFRTRSTMESRANAHYPQAKPLKFRSQDS